MIAGVKMTANVAGSKNKTKGIVIFVLAAETKASSLCFLFVLRLSAEIAREDDMLAPILSA